MVEQIGTMTSAASYLLRVTLFATLPEVVPEMIVNSRSCLRWVIDKPTSISDMTATVWLG